MTSPMVSSLVNSTSRSKYDLHFDDVHEGLRPVDVRPTDRILARVRKRNANEPFRELRVWKTSPRAVELVYPASGYVVEKGEAVDLELSVAGQRMLFEGLVIDEIHQNHEARRIGIRYARRVERWVDDERRTSPRWVCSDQYFPVCVATSPFMESGAAMFRVVDVSAVGMQLSTDIKNTYLIPKLRVRLIVNFLLVGDFVTTVEVVRVGFGNTAGRDTLNVGVRFTSVTSQMRSIIGQYLIEFSNVPSLQALRDTGLKPASPTRGVQYYFVKSEEDIRAIWKLRREAHIDSNNLSDEAVADEDMTDVYDLDSRIIAGVYNGKIVATARIHFGSLDKPLEIEQYVALPDHLPRRDKIFEISRAAISPEFQSGDLFIGLIQFIAHTCMREEKPFIVISSWPHLVPMYERLGFTRTELTFKEKFWKREQTVLMANGMTGLFGSNVNPIVWNMVWRKPAERLIENGIVEPKGMNRIRFEIYKRFRFLSKCAEYFRRRPRMRS